MRLEVRVCLALHSEQLPNPHRRPRAVGDVGASRPESREGRPGCARCSPRLEGLADGVACRRRPATFREAKSSPPRRSASVSRSSDPGQRGIPGPAIAPFARRSRSPRPLVTCRTQRGREKGRDPELSSARIDRGLTANLNRKSKHQSTRCVIRGKPRTVSSIRSGESDHGGGCGRWTKTGAKGERKFRNDVARSRRLRSKVRSEACSKPS